MDSSFDTNYEPFLGARNRESEDVNFGGIRSMQSVVTSSGLVRTSEDVQCERGVWHSLRKFLLLSKIRVARVAAVTIISTMILAVCSMFFFMKDSNPLKSQANTFFTFTSSPTSSFRTAPSPSNPTDLSTASRFYDDSFEEELPYEATPEYFDSFVQAHSKHYPPSEKKFRYMIFKENAIRIARHNSNPDRSYTLRINHFADITDEEFSARLGYKLPPGHLEKRATPAPSPVVSHKLPPEIDWRKKGCVTPVKDQGQCGSCWAFATTGSIEGAYCLAKGELISLSEQQILDCDRDDSSSGCDGGITDSAYKWVTENHGLCSEEDYKYKGIDENCVTKCTNSAYIDKFVDIPPNDPQSLRYELTTHGPVAVAIDADYYDFRFYHSGVIPGKHVKFSLNHAVLVVGYGYDKKLKKQFWVVKNSWGASWGEEGYIRIDAGDNSPKEGGFGILMAPSYPVV